METPSLFASGYGLDEGRQLEPNRAVEKNENSFSCNILYGNISDRRENSTLSYWKTWIPCNFLCLKPSGYHPLLHNKPHVFAPLRSWLVRGQNRASPMTFLEISVGTYHFRPDFTEENSIRGEDSLTHDHTYCKMDWTIINMTGCSCATEDEERMGFNGRLEFSRSSVIDQLHKDHSSLCLHVSTLKMWCWGFL